MVVVSGKNRLDSTAWSNKSKGAKVSKAGLEPATYRLEVCRAAIAPLRMGYGGDCSYWGGKASTSEEE